MAKVRSSNVTLSSTYSENARCSAGDLLTAAVQISRIKRSYRK